MNDLPTYSKLDADRILRRAAEIDGAEDGRRLTVDELRSIANEAGFGRRAVDLAIAEAQEALFTEVHRPPVQKWGWVFTHLVTTRQIPIQISTAQLMNAVRLLQPYREGPPNVKLEEQEITWRDRKGLRFAVTSVGGVTEIRVYVDKFLLRKRRWIRWVKAAADRLEVLVYMVANKEAAQPEALPPG